MSLWKLLTARWGSGAGEVDEVRIDASTNTLQTIEYPHHEIHSGSHFFLEGYATLGNGDALYVKLVTPNTTRWSHFLWEINASGILTSTLTEAPTGLEDGAGVTIFNNNRNSATTSGTIVTSGVTAPTGGTIISKVMFGSRQFGGGQARDSELILKQNTTYGRTFLSGAASNIVNFRASSYEHTDKH